MSGADRAIVIGAGFGGLAAAVRLRARGYEVTVLEGMDQPGGRAAVFHRDGYTFDAGPTVLTAPYLIGELFEAVGRDPDDYFRLLPVDPFYRIEFEDGTHFDYVGDEERLLAQIAAMAPDDVEGYRRLAAHSEKIFHIGYERLSDVPFGRLADMLRIAPEMMRLGNHRSVYDQVAMFVKDERLRQVFSFQPLLVGGNPFNVTSIYLLIHWLERKWGVWFAKGGTTAVVHALAKLLDELGVEIRYDTPVDRLIVENRRVCGVEAGGRRYRADVVVANADPTQVYGTLLPEKDRSWRIHAALATRKFSMGLFVAYFGTRKTYPGLAHHTIILGPRYRELLHDIFERKVLADDFSLYLHAPTRSDPSLAPPGHEAFYVLSPVPNAQSGIDWTERGDEYLARILDFLDVRYLPGLRENLDTSFYVTPRYFEETLRSTHGAGFGIEPRLSQSAYFRYHNESPHFGGLYFVGASTHPGAGVPGVLSTAKVLDRVVPDPARPAPLPARAPAAA